MPTICVLAKENIAGFDAVEYGKVVVESNRIFLVYEIKYFKFCGWA